MPRIFISYSRTDQAFAMQLATALSDGGADVWIDVEDIPAGMKWSSAIQEGLDTSDAMLVVVSPEAMASRNVEDEWQYFIDNNRTVLTIRHRPAKLHYQLHRIQYIDFHNQPFDHAFWRLVSELERASVKGIAASKPPSTSARPTRPAVTRPVPVFKPQEFVPYTPAISPESVNRSPADANATVKAKMSQRPKSEPRVARPSPPAPPAERLERLKQPPPLAKPAKPWWNRWQVWGAVILLAILLFQDVIVPLLQR